MSVRRPGSTRKPHRVLVAGTLVAARFVTSATFRRPVASGARRSSEGSSKRSGRSSGESICSRAAWSRKTTGSRTLVGGNALTTAASPARVLSATTASTQGRGERSRTSRQAVAFATTIATTTAEASTPRPTAPTRATMGGSVLRVAVPGCSRTVRVVSSATTSATTATTSANHRPVASGAGWDGVVAIPRTQAAAVQASRAARAGPLWRRRTSAESTSTSRTTVSEAATTGDRAA